MRRCNTTPKAKTTSIARSTGPDREVDKRFSWSACVEPPAGIEPATPSLPRNHQEPLCGPPFPQLTPHRQGQSYRFSFDEVMRSPSHQVLIIALETPRSRSNPVE